MNYSIKDYLKYLAGLISLVLFIGVFLFVLNEGDNTIKRLKQEKENAIKIDQYFIVEDKHENVELIGDLLNEVYYLDVHSEGNSDIKERIKVNSGVYQDTEISDKILCTIFYSNGNVIDIEPVL